MPTHRTFDWRSRHDPRSRNYAIRDKLDVQVTSRFWTPGQVLDQGSEGACVGFGWSGELACEPVKITVSNASAFELYEEAKTLDRWPGEDYSGSSVLAGAKALMRRGQLVEYRWAFGIEDVRDAILGHGPVVLGIPWYEGMYDAPNGRVAVSGIKVGGHCILATGYDMGWFRLRNSWGPSWGIGGDADIREHDLAYLLNDDGEACVPTDAVPGSVPRRRSCWPCARLKTARLKLQRYLKGL